MKAHSAVVLSLAVLLVGFGSAPSLPPGYEELLHRYASGDRDGALREVGAWPDVRLRDTVRQASSLAKTAAACAERDCVPALVWERFPVRVALMLHSDAADQARRVGGSPRLHESAALEFARIAVTEVPRPGSEMRQFVARWYAAVALQSQADARFEEALAWADRGLTAFPESADLLLVVGSVEEVLAAQSSVAVSEDLLQDTSTRRLGAEWATSRERREHLARARQAMLRAVAAAPERRDVRIRLGRIAWKLGDGPAADAALRSVLASAAAPSEAYLAQLFLGRVFEDEGRLEDAADAYAAAKGIERQSQTAPLALSHVRLLLGDPADARQQLELAIRPAGFRFTNDPFWVYPWGASSEAAARLQTLRREASS
jgi:hypothetical protein